MPPAAWHLETDVFVPQRPLSPLSEKRMFVLTAYFFAQRRWHQFHSPRSLDGRVSPSYFLPVCKEVEGMKTYNKTSRQCRR